MLSSLLITLVVISGLVVVHELGHFFTARRFGVTVYEFSVGFGPLLAQTERKGIKYSLRAVPLGGFCKIAGMDMALEGEAKEKARPGERVFYELPLYQKILIMLAGSVSNLFLAMLTFIFIAAAIGLPDQVEEKALIGFVEPKSPAFEAGLSAGDEIIEINGEPIQRWEDLGEIIQQSPGKPMLFKVRRGEHYFTKEIIPFYDPGIDGGRIGVMRAYTVKRLPLSQAVSYGVYSTAYGIKAIIVSVYQMIAGRERAEFLGPVGLVGAVDQARQSGLHFLFSMVTSISLFLGLFNLLPVPLPLLDGGWIVIFLIERLRRKEFSAEQKAMAQMVGMLFMVVFFLMITFGDIGSIIRRLTR